MVKEQEKIINLIARAGSKERIEGLLEALIAEASFEDVAKIRAALNERLLEEKTREAKYNYCKALEFLD